MHCEYQGVTAKFRLVIRTLSGDGNVGLPKVHVHVNGQINYSSKITDKLIVLVLTYKRKRSEHAGKVLNINIMQEGGNNTLYARNT